MKDKVNIIIPAIKLDDELLTCLGKINKISYKDYFVTIVLDHKNKSKLPKFKFKINQMVVGKINMSKKRNLASSINEGIALSKFENIIWLDADFQHPPKYLEDFIKYSNKNDIIIASRFLKNSNRYFQDDKFKKKTNENQSYIYNKICKSDHTTT